MEENKIVKYLERLSIFQGAPESLFEKLASKVTLRSLAKGEVLAKEGDPSNSLFVIRTGWIKIVASGPNGEEVVLNQCGPSQIVGEMSLIDRQPRSNAMVALSPTEVFEISYDVVLEALNDYPLLALSFLRDMSDRLRFANAYIEETIVWSQHIAAGNYDFVQERVEETHATIVSTSLSYQARASAFLSAFFKMVEGVKKREESLKRQVQELTIQIDEVKRQKAVKELTENEFFENLQATAHKLRQERAAKQNK
jgi:CRP-like cAMP-binding protein